MTPDTNPPRVSIVVPAYNEADIISSTVGKLLVFLESMSLGFELIVADDGSIDQTRHVVNGMHQTRPEVRLLSNGKNIGRGAMLKLAFSQARGAILAYVDADLPFDLSILGAALSKVQGGYDMAMASKYAPGASMPAPLVRKLAGRTYSALVRSFLGLPFFDCQGGLKVIRKDAVNSVLPDVHDNRWGWDTEFVVKAWRQGLRIAEIPVSGTNRWRAKSHVKFVKDSCNLFLNLIRLRREATTHSRTAGSLR